MGNIVPTSQGKNSQLRWDMIKKELQFINGMTLVDIGCENGYFCNAFLEAGGKSAHGVEVNDSLIAECNGLGLKDFTVTKDLPDGQFDVCFYLSLHFHNGIDYLKWCSNHSLILFVETSGSPEVTTGYNIKLKKELSSYYCFIKELGITPYAGRMLYLCY